MAKQVEDIGILPRQSMLSRERIVATPSGAILYIAAIMHAFVLSMARVPDVPDLQCDTPALVALYTSGDLRNREDSHMFASDVRRNPSALWAEANLGWLTETLGTPSPSFCHR